MTEATNQRRQRSTAAFIERLKGARAAYGLGTTRETWNDKPQWSREEGDRRIRQAQK